MSKKASPTLVGGFIIVGIALAVGGVLLFSSTKLFVRSQKCIVYFDATLTGLDPGAPVRFRGVAVGQVKELMLHHNQDSNDRSVPVVIELSGDIHKQGRDSGFDLLNKARLAEYVERGLRAKLETQSLFTGVLYVDLEFLPEVPAVYHQQGKTYLEIPAAPVEVQLLRVDLSKVVDKLTSTLTKLDDSLGELSMRDINHGLTNLLTSLGDLVRGPGLTNSLSSLQVTLEEFRALTAKLRSRIDALADEAGMAFKESRQTFSEVRGGVQDLRDLVAPQAPLRRELSEALEQLGEASRSVAALAEYLRQHPNALLTGRRPADSKP